MTQYTSDQMDIFHGMTEHLSDAEQQWLHARFVEDKPLSEVAILFHVEHAPTYEQQILRKMRRVSIQDRLFDQITECDS